MRAVTGAMLRGLALHLGPGWKRSKGSRKGQYSIRINDQDRISFGWTDGNAFTAEITGYH